MIKNLLFIAGVLLCLQTQAQNPSYRSYNYSGYLIGEHDGFQMLTIHGLEKGTCFLGIGAGLDTYIRESFPFFLSASKYLSPSAKGLYISLNGGSSYMFKSAIVNIRGAIGKSSVLRPFAEGGLGYRLGLKTLKPGQGLLFGAFYSYKGLREKFTFREACNNPPCGERYEYLDYKLSRWGIRLGLAL